MLNKHNEDYFYYDLDIDKLYDSLDEDDINYMAYSIEEKQKINIGSLETVLINSDFNVNFKIKRNILHSILKDDYQIVSRFEPGIYPGVNNKYYYNTDYLDKQYPGGAIVLKDVKVKVQDRVTDSVKKLRLRHFKVVA